MSASSAMCPHDGTEAGGRPLPRRRRQRRYGRCTGRHGERGVSLVSAIFLLVVLAMLAAVAVRLTAVQQQTVVLGLRSAQAFHAARSGVGWAASRALTGGWCGTQTLNLNEAGTSGFDVSVSCSQSTHVEAGATINVYTIVALAESGVYGGPDYVSRRIEAKVTDG